MVRSPARRAAERARKLELADIFRAHAQELRRSAPLPQRRVIRAIESCRTAALGGHLERCARCDAERAVYHSCRNRHCPKCQTLAKERWLEARKAELLPIEYFHLVFTLPHALNSLIQGCPRRLYDLLFQSASATLQSFARDPAHLGGEIGLTAILHTWGQNLSQHVHLHCIVTGGGLSPDQAQFVRTRRGFLFPVRALSKVFRGKFLAGLHEARARGDLPSEPRVPWATLRATPWVVYAKPSFAHPEAVLDYLGRYTHRIAISNERILALRNGVVHFRWRDSRKRSRLQVMQLRAPEFLRRFLLHVLPCGFVRIRHFGLLANRQRKRKIERCRKLLQAPSPPPSPEPEEPPAHRILRLTGLDVLRCPVCASGRMQRVAELPRLRSPRLGFLDPAPILDTS